MLIARLVRQLMVSQADGLGQPGWLGEVGQADEPDGPDGPDGLGQPG